MDCTLSSLFVVPLFAVLSFSSMDACKVGINVLSLLSCAGEEGDDADGGDDSYGFSVGIHVPCFLSYAAAAGDDDDGVVDMQAAK